MCTLDGRPGQGLYNATCPSYWWFHLLTSPVIILQLYAKNICSIISSSAMLITRRTTHRLWVNTVAVNHMVQTIDTQNWIKTLQR